MDKLIEKIKEKKRGTNCFESPSYNNSSIGDHTPSESSNQKKYPRVCVDFRYLSD
jgi:hypothetical protein